MHYIKVAIGVLIALSASRFIPHPPNFTSLIALSFYIPALFGRKYIVVVILSFFVTDLIIGFHPTLLFTWGSVLIIGLTSNYFKNLLSMRMLGCLLGALIFFIITNFGVWLQGGYEYSMNGLIICYILAIPFFGNTFIATLIYSFLIELSFSIYKSYFSKKIFER